MNTPAQSISQTITTALAALTETLLNAQLVAIKRLAQIVESSENPAESRRAATSLLRLRLPRLQDLLPTPAPAPTAPPQPPTSTESLPLKTADGHAFLYHHAGTPLIPDELDMLQAMFPGSRKNLFTQSRTPQHWRFQIYERNNHKPPAFADAIAQRTRTPRTG